MSDSTDGILAFVIFLIASLYFYGALAGIKEAIQDSHKERTERLQHSSPDAYGPPGPPGSPGPPGDPHDHKPVFYYSSHRERLTMKEVARECETVAHEIEHDPRLRAIIARQCEEVARSDDAREREAIAREYLAREYPDLMGPGHRDDGERGPTGKRGVFASPDQNVDRTGIDLKRALDEAEKEWNEYVVKQNRM